jgi:pantoate--beta-alanine ligase
VVAKLLIQADPDVAVFGEKDYQQLLVIKRLVSDLDLRVQILPAPTARDGDGLALSSRNAYLDARERVIAGRLNVVLRETAKAIAGGADVVRAEGAGRAALLQAGFDSVDYLEARAAEDLARFHHRVDRAARVFAAARIGRTRLIDNVAVD